MISLLNMDHSKPAWKVSRISRWNLLLVAFYLLNFSNASTTSRKTKTVTPTTTALKPECPQMDLSKCPGGWFPMRDKTCMKVEKAKQNFFGARHSCSNYGGSLLDYNLDDVTKACVLEQSGNDPNASRMIWLRLPYVLNVQTKNIERESAYIKHSYACIIQNYASTTSRKTTTVSPTTTALKPECPQMDLSKCPGGWFPMRDKTCMKVEKAKKYHYHAETSCRIYGGSLVDYNLDDVTKACILEQSDNDPNASKMIWLQWVYFLNVQTKNIERGNGFMKHSYACSIQNYEKPRITSFQITIINGQYNASKTGITYQTEILSTDFLVMKINDLFLNFTCQASGILLSEVEIVESVTDKTQVSHGVPFTYQKPPGACGPIASFACKATNTFGDSGKSKTIGILAECPSQIVEFQEHLPDVPYNSHHKQILTCKAKGYPPPDLLLSKLGVDAPLTSTLGQNILNYTWPKTQCENIGTHKCQSTNKFNKETVWQTFDLRVRGCSPQLCPWESASKTVYIETGDTKTVSICLVSSTVLYPHDTVAVNGIMFDNGQDNGKFLVEYHADEENDMYYNVNLTVRNISMDDYGQLSVTIWSHYQTETEWSSNSLEYNITLNKEDDQDFVGELIVDAVEEDIVDAVGEEIPVSVSESQVDYVGENLDMWKTLQTESKYQKIEELFTTAKKWLDNTLGIDLCKTPHSSRMRMEGLWTEFIKVMYLVNCV